MSRGGRRKDRSTPERRCIVTGEVRPKRELLRFVVGPDGVIVPDVLEKLPGRGIWVLADRKALEEAIRRKLFSRAARMQVEIPEGIADEVEKQLARRVIDLIALARKAGLAVTGYEKVKGWLESGRARVLIQASDGSERGKSRLRPPEGGNGHIGILSARELGLAFGRENVIHGALASGGLTTRVVEEAERLKGLRANLGASGAGKDKTTT